jgi:exodeoxyribonuclease V alpha subunit
MSGTFHVLVFDVLESSGYAAPKSTKATGHLFGISQIFRGVVLELEGEWITHPKYGRQFKIRSWRPWSRHTFDVQAFFQFAVAVFEDHNLMERFVEFFGNDSYDALMGDSAVTFAGDNEIAKKALQEAGDRWRMIRAIATLADFLQEYELGASLIAAVFDKFGFDSVDVLAMDPYRLVEIDGISFQRADQIAERRGIAPGDPRRLAAAVLWSIRDQTRQYGHLYLRRGDLAPMLSELVSKSRVVPFAVPDLTQAVSDALAGLEKNDAVKVDPDVGVYPPDLYLFERGGAGMLSRFLTPADLSLDLGQFLFEYEKANGIELSDLQREAVAQLISNRVLVVTGAPGTGKTTLIKAFVHFFRALGISHALMAPTGIASKRLSHVTEAGASTIHRALKYDGHHWGFNGMQKFDVQAVIVDELSMVDQELFYRLLDALEPTTMLVLVGDDAQLPSVGAGNVLRELIGCPSIPTIRLEHVFRQAETSDIVLAAHKIRRGESPLGLPQKPASEFQFSPCADEERIANRIVELAVKLKSRDANFQVLSPKYEGIVGVDNLNARLRDALNPDVGQASCDLLNFNVRLGDRVMIIKNNYKLNVYNGDIGKLLEIHRDCLRIRIHGIGQHPDTVVDIPRNDAPSMLKLAYAVTVHKSQGEEFETVILPLVRGQGRMLQRNLFYTAITRARKKVCLLGEADAVLKAVANAKVQQRNTVFRSLIVPHV